MDMEFGEILSYLLTAVGGGGLSGLVFWRLNKRAKKAEVQKQEAEAEQNKIENINQIVEGVYKPMIESLSKRVEALDNEVHALREEREFIAKRHEEEIEAIKRDCAEKSELMRKQIIELSVELAKKADRPSRGKNGQFSKKDK